MYGSQDRLLCPGANPCCCRWRLVCNPVVPLCIGGKHNERELTCAFLPWQGGAAKPDSFSTGSAYPREAEGEDPGEPGGRADEADGEGPPSSGAKDAPPLRVETQPPIRQYPLMREV